MIKELNSSNILNQAFYLKLFFSSSRCIFAACLNQHDAGTWILLNKSIIFSSFLWSAGVCWWKWKMLVCVSFQQIYFKQVTAASACRPHSSTNVTQQKISAQTRETLRLTEKQNPECVLVCVRVYMCVFCLCRCVSVYMCVFCVCRCVSECTCVCFVFLPLTE